MCCSGERSMVFRDRPSLNASPGSSSPGAQIQSGIRYRLMQNLASITDAALVQTDEGNAAFSFESTRQEMRDVLVLRDIDGSVRCLCLVRTRVWCWRLTYWEAMDVVWHVSAELRFPRFGIDSRSTSSPVPTGSSLGTSEAASSHSTAPAAKSRRFPDGGSCCRTPLGSRSPLDRTTRWCSRSQPRSTCLPMTSTTRGSVDGTFSTHCSEPTTKQSHRQFGGRRPPLPSRPASVCRRGGARQAR